MNFVTRPPIDANGHAGDELDETLSAFFRSEMPRPWPQFKVPDDRPAVRPAEPVPLPSRRPWFRSPRFVLAASVALLIAGYAAMSAALTPPTSANDPTLNGGGASPRGILREMHPKDPAEDDLDFRGWLEQDGNKPTTIHIEMYRKK
jgi:hypothetical protein